MRAKHLPTACPGRPDSWLGCWSHASGYTSDSCLPCWVKTAGSLQVARNTPWKRYMSTVSSRGWFWPYGACCAASPSASAVTILCRPPANGRAELSSNHHLSFTRVPLLQQARAPRVREIRLCWTTRTTRVCSVTRYSPWRLCWYSLGCGATSSCRSVPPLRRRLRRHRNRALKVALPLHHPISREALLPQPQRILQHLIPPLLPPTIAACRR